MRTNHHISAIDMTRKRPQITSRKQPQQTRSTELVSAILQAATQVLADEGVTRFTTARVAERAGVSVGSLYQYFPNKAAILFRLQVEEWRETSEMLSSILEDVGKPAFERLRMLVQAFIRSECEEAPMRVALNDAAPLYRDAPEIQQARAAADLTFERFIEEVLPRASAQTRALAGELIVSTFASAGKSFSEQPRTEAQIKAYADAMADMFCAYLTSLR